MTAAEIRAMNVREYQTIEIFKAEMLQEIAAQLIEFNERCAKNCSPMGAKDDWAGPLLVERNYNKKKLKKIAEILEQVDNRCMVADGPVSKTREEITDEELIEIYKLATWK